MANQSTDPGKRGISDNDVVAGDSDTGCRTTLLTSNEHHCTGPVDAMKFQPSQDTMRDVHPDEKNVATMILSNEI